MARRRGKKKSGGGGFLARAGGRAGIRGVVSPELLATVAGTIGAGVLGPTIARLIPANMRKTRTTVAISGVAIGLGGYMLLRKYNRAAALGFAAATIGPVLAAMILPAATAKRAGVSGMEDMEGDDELMGDDEMLQGIGEPEGVSYLPEGMSGDDDLEGLGAYDDQSIEV